MHVKMKTGNVSQQFDPKITTTYIEPFVIYGVEHFMTIPFGGSGAFW